MIVKILIGIGSGILSGLGAAALGFAKSAGSEFDWKNFVQTLIVGGFVGGVAGYIGITYQNSLDWLATTGGLTLFEYIKKAILRRIYPWLEDQMKKA